MGVYAAGVVGGTSGTQVGLAVFGRRVRFGGGAMTEWECSALDGGDTSGQAVHSERCQLERACTKKFRYTDNMQCWGMADIEEEGNHYGPCC